MIRFLFLHMKNEILIRKLFLPFIETLNFRLGLNSSSNLEIILVQIIS